MKKIKLIKIIAPTLSAGIIVSTIAPLCSCKLDSQDEKKKPDVPTTKGVKLNMAAAPNQVDLVKKETPLTVTSSYDGIIYCEAYKPADMKNVTIQYRYGDRDESFWEKDWTTIKEDETINFSMNPYTIIQFRAAGVTDHEGELNTASYQFHIRFGGGGKSGSGGISIGGSMLSMVSEIVKDGEDEYWYGRESLTSEYCFAQLFDDSSELEHVSANFLPFKTISPYCYYGMFAGCPSLAEAPALPAMKHWGTDASGKQVELNGLPEGCYKEMFIKCLSLTIAPHLPATKLAQDCYVNMFAACPIISASLAYVGNFDAKYFQYWMMDPASDVGTFYYNGLDTKRGESSIPEGFTVVQDNDLIQNKTVTFEVGVDNTSSQLTGNMSRIRAYKDFDGADLEEQVDAMHTNVIAGDEHAYDKNESNTQIVWTGKTASEIYSQTGTSGKIIPMYGFYPTEISDCANVITQAASVITATFPSDVQVQYYIVGESKDWTDFTSGVQLSVPAHKQVKLQATAGTKSASSYTNIRIDGNVRLEGTVKTLVETSLGKPEDSIPAFGCYGLFENSKGITEVSENFLNVTDYSWMAYANMFKGCSSLTAAPKLFANASGKATSGLCYHMFDGCSSLETFGELPFTTMASPYETDGSYGVFEGMFANCKLLKKVAPTSGIQVHDITTYGMYQMFLNCEKLDVAPSLTVNSATYPTSSSSRSTFSEMFAGCKGMKSANAINLTFNNASNVIIGCGGFYKMFYNCTSLAETAEVSNPWPNFSTTRNIAAVKARGMESMFEGCTGLKRVPTDTLNLMGLKESITDPSISKSIPGLTGYSLNRTFFGCTSLVKPMYMGWINVDEAAYMHTEMYAGCTSLKIKPSTRGSDGRPNTSTKRFFQCMGFQKGRGDHSSFCDYMFKDCKLSGDWDYTDGTPNWISVLQSSKQYSYEWIE